MRSKFYNFFTVVIYFIFVFYLNINNSYSKDLVITAEIVDIKENGNLIFASGNVNITDNKNISITGNEVKYNKIDSIAEIKGDVILIDKEKNFKASSDIIIYEKNKNILKTIGNVILNNNINNYNIYSDKIIYDRLNGIIKSFGETKIEYQNEYAIYSNDITYNDLKKIFYSNKKTKIEDQDNSKFELSEFQFDLKEKIFKANKINFSDRDNNLLEMNNGLVNINNKEIVGSDFKFTFNKNILGNSENDPRLFGRYLITNQSEMKMKKSIFTSCKIIEGKCPAWSLSADDITHVKSKKRIEYKNAWLKIYDTPVAYFPYFFHPDPSVKRQSGFLFPEFYNSSNLGFSTQIPYYKVLDYDKDLTISPRLYTNDNIFFQSEYRQEFENSNLVTDISYNKKDNSNSHFFSTLKGEFDNSYYELRIESVSNTNYLKKYQVKSPLIKNYSTLNSTFLIETQTDDSNFSSSIDIIEDLTKQNSDRYEYIFPNYEFSSTSYLDDGVFETINYKSSGSYRKFNTNVDEAELINDLVFSSSNNFNFLSYSETDFKFLIRNINTYGDLSQNYKDDKDYKILNTLLYNVKYPLFKNEKKGKNFLTPMASLRYSPNKGLNLKNESITPLTFQDLFNLDRINNKTIESGEALTLGLEYKKINNYNEDKLNLGLAINYRNEEDRDLPTSSSLGKKTSDLIGYSGINITENLSFDYNFSIDNSLSETNYSLASLNYSSNKFKTSFEYMEKSNHIGDESYLINSAEFEINKSNLIAFETNKNLDKNITDYYNLIYKYKNDCLEASLVYNKQYYNEDDINSGNNLFFKISIIPFGQVSSPNISNE